MLTARPVQPLVGRVAASIRAFSSFHIFDLLLQLFDFHLYVRLEKTV